MPIGWPYHGMVALVATRKITITLPEETLEHISALARAEGLPLSTYVTRLAEHRIRIEAGLAAMREWEEEHGPISDEAYSWAEEQIARAEASMRRSTKAAG
jgi:Arc/MetJ-type ribon-helix-helix transcriptional regulator